MQNESGNTVRLVQIEKRSTEKESAKLATLPALTEGEIFRKKVSILIRKSLAVFYTRSFYGTARRWIFSTFLPESVLKRWMPYRQGECNRCGMCCRIVLTCPFLHEEDQQAACRIFTSKRHAPPPCLTFPLDPRDLADVQRQIAPTVCSFSFEGQPEYPDTRAALMAELRLRLRRGVERLREAF